MPEIPLRLAREYIYQLEHAGQHERLHHTLSTIPVFVTLYQEETRYETLRLWSAVERERISAMVNAGLTGWRERRRPDAEELEEVLARVSALLTDTGCWQDAMRLCEERVEIARAIGHRAREARALMTLAWLEYLRGVYPESERHVREAESIARELGNRIGIASAVGHRGLVLYALGNYDAAMECYGEQESIARELNDHANIAIAIGNRGVVHSYRGEYDSALACYREQEEIARETGNRGSLALTVGNRGVVYIIRKEYDAALACYREQESIAREIGDRRVISIALGNLGLIYRSRGENAQALACYVEVELIARELGDRNSMGITVGSRGLIHASRGEYDEALACYAEAESIAREMGDRRSIATALGCRGHVYSEQGEYEQALACYAEAADLHRAIGFLLGLSDWLHGTARALLGLVGSTDRMPEYLTTYLPDNTDERWHAISLRLAREHAEESRAISERVDGVDTLFGTRLLLARIDAAEGKTDDALHDLRRMLDESTETEQRAQLLYWMWKIGEQGAGSGEQGAGSGEQGAGSGEQGAGVGDPEETSSSDTSQELSPQPRVSLRTRGSRGSRGTEDAMFDAREPGDRGFNDTPGPFNDREEALRLYRQLIEKTPKHEYRMRIEELVASADGGDHV